MGEISGDYGSADLAERLSELKSLVCFIDYFERHLGVEIDDPHNEEIIRFSLVVENTTLMTLDYNDILNEVDYEKPYELSEHLEELDLIYAQALLIKLIQIERIHEVYWKQAVLDGTFLRILKRFSIEIELLESNKNYYVYALVDPKNNFVPFYIGKGVNKRVYNHFSSTEALEILSDEASKLRKISELMELGYEKNDLARILAKNLTEDEAFLLESFLIKTVYGFENLTNKIHGKHHLRFRQHNVLESYNDFDEFLVGRKKVNQSRSHIAANYIARGKDQPLHLIEQELSELSFTSMKVLDSGEFGMEADVKGIANLKIFLRSTFIYIELWPRRKSQKIAIVNHFEKLGIREKLKRADLVFRPEPWSSKENRTNDVNEIIRRARLLIEFLHVTNAEELTNFNELFVET